MTGGLDLSKHCGAALRAKTLLALHEAPCLLIRGKMGDGYRVAIDEDLNEVAAVTGVIHVARDPVHS